MADDYPPIKDGFEALRDELSDIVRMVADTAWWVHPETFKLLPVWFPEFRRGQALADKTWVREYTNTRGSTGLPATATESNKRAKRALVGALGARSTKNMGVCHIWGYDDPEFKSAQSLTANRNFYSCVGNMIWLPGPLMGLTDGLSEVKNVLRYCALQMYDWPTDLRSYLKPENINSPPAYYPAAWPTSLNRVLPKNTAPLSARVRKSIERRKSELKRQIGDRSLAKFPHAEVDAVLKKWSIAL